MTVGAYGLSAGDFLGLYGVLLAMVVVAGLMIPAWLRPAGREQQVTDPDLLAYLAGGSTRLVDAIVTRALASGQLAMDGKNSFIAQTAFAGAGPTIASDGPMNWAALVKQLGRDTERVRERLVNADLLMDGRTVAQLRFWQTVPYLALLLFGAVRWQVGVALGHPVSFLTGLMLVTALFALIRYVVVDRRTRAGIAAVRSARLAADRIRRAPTRDETGMAVALFGTAVLAGSAWQDYHRLRSTGGDVGSSDSGSSGCSGGGGGGCGGGGCGG